MFKRLKLSCNDSGLFFARLAVAVPFIVHGWMKLTNMAGTVAFFGTLGLAAPFAWLVALLEFVGGIALLLGIGVRYVATALAGIMFFAIILVRGKTGAFAGHELELVLLLSSLALSFAGAGSCSVDAKMCKEKDAKKDECCGSGGCCK